jgi:chromosome segregation ATPase
MTRCNHLAARADGACRICDRKSRAALDRLQALNEIAEASQRQQSANNPLTDTERQLASRHAATERYIAAQERQRIAALNHALLEQEAARATTAADLEEVRADLDALLSQSGRSHAELVAYMDALAEHLAEHRTEAREAEIKRRQHKATPSAYDPNELLERATPHPLGGLPERLRLAEVEAEAMRNLDVAAHTSYKRTTDYCHRGHELVAENVIELSGGDPEHPQRICKSCRETYAALPDHLKKHWNR